MIHLKLGTSKYISFEVTKTDKEILEDAIKTRNVLSSNKQAHWAALRLSVNQRFQYLCQHVHPTLCEPVAAWLDNELWKEIEYLVGQSIPRTYRGHEGDLVVTLPMEKLSGASFQEWVIRLPVKLHGWGFRSLEETCAPAFIGTLEASIPRMYKISPILTSTWGGEERWGVGANIDERWKTLLDSGCLEATELNRAWASLALEARESADWLGIETEHVFTVSLPGLGEGSVDGTTRGDIVTARERTRAKLLSKALDEYTPKKARPAWAWRQRDKISSSWLLALPGPDSSLSNPEFSEAASSNLCLPSPAYVERLGETVKGNKKVDIYGNNVQAAPLSGDHWRKRHDMMKNTLHRLCVWSALPCEVEVLTNPKSLVEVKVKS